MINRSVPGYASILSMIGELSQRYVQPNTHVYDLGCSLGHASLIMHQRIPTSCHIYAIDSSSPMLNQMKRRLRETLPDSDWVRRITPQLGDIRHIELSNASFCVLNFTLQFIPLEDRATLIQDIFNATLPGGALVVSEKVCFEDRRRQQLLNDLHLQFKRANGYSELEIAQKRTALEETLIPESIDCHLTRLRQAGFNQVACWFQCFNFVSILAVK